MAAYAPVGAGAPGTKLDEVIGVVKAYSTCVGEGPFTAEWFGEEADRLLGFALGADDYIVKPFSPREIVSRIRVIFRRINSLETAQEKNELQIGNTRINLSRYEVCVDGEKVVFSPKEVEILHLMAAHLNQVFTREQLLDSIWGFDFDGDSRVVDTSIKRIRKKLPEYSMLAGRSVYGVGYKIEAANA